MGSRSLHSQIKEGKNSPQLNDVEEVRASRGPLLGVPESFCSQLISPRKPRSSNICRGREYLFTEGSQKYEAMDDPDMMTVLEDVPNSKQWTQRLGM
jgi:hypothetical protein